MSEAIRECEARGQAERVSAEPSKLPYLVKIPKIDFVGFLTGKIFSFLWSRH